MKGILTYLILLNANLLYAQTYCDYYCQDFEDTICLSQFIIDTAAYPQNIWQIGRPQKLVIDTSNYSSNVIITDTMNSYPIDNQSVFIIKNIATFGDIYGCKMFNGAYFVQTDSLNDYGLIEFSPDKGMTWIDIINDTLYSSSFVWYSSKPILTGKTDGWRGFDMLFADNGSVFDIEYGDTLMFRFSFYSDSTFDSLDGLAYDNLCFQDFVEGISETHFTPIMSKIYPNPSTDNFIIEFENSTYEGFELSVYDIKSKLIIRKDKIFENKVFLDTRTLKSGIYIYKLTNINAKKRSWGKFVLDR
jgi:hypothetical protein